MDIIGLDSHPIIVFSHILNWNIIKIRLDPLSFSSVCVREREGLFCFHLPVFVALF